MSKHSTTNAVRVEQRDKALLQARVARAQRAVEAATMAQLRDIIKCNNERRGLAA